MDNETIHSDELAGLDDPESEYDGEINSRGTPFLTEHDPFSDARFIVCMLNCALDGNLAGMKSLYLAHGDRCWHHQIVIDAVYKGHIDCARYAYENGCIFSWGWKPYSLVEVKILHEQVGITLTSSQLCLNASLAGNIDMLIYAHEHGCPWNDYTCISAATLDCLKYAHEHGCPWHSGVLSRAILYGQMDQYEYAVKNGLWWDDYSIRDLFMDDYVWDVLFGIESESMITDSHDFDYINKKLTQCIESGCILGTLEDIASEGIRLNVLEYVKFAVSKGLTVTVQMGIDATTHLGDCNILRFLYDECGLRIPPEHTFTEINESCQAFLEERGHVLRFHDECVISN
jgi:hypothetical protein